MSIGRWARLVATIVMVGAVVTMVHGSEAPKFGFDGLGFIAAVRHAMTAHKVAA